jgi:hypothetical protein
VCFGSACAKTVVALLIVFCGLTVTAMLWWPGTSGLGASGTTLKDGHTRTCLVPSSDHLDFGRLPRGQFTWLSGRQ